MRILLGIFIAIAIAAVGGLVIIFGGPYNVAASDPHFRIVRWALDTTFKNSVKRQASGLRAPDLSDPSIVRSGARAYASYCAQCHGVPGEGTPEMAQHMRPQPPHLSRAASEWRPEELFWIVQNGVKMTGMPAWGWQPNHRLWQIVAFVNQMPEMTSDEYKKLVSTKDEHTDAARGDASQQTAAAEKRAEAGSTKSDSQSQSKPAKSDSGNADDDAAKPAAVVDMTDKMTFEPRSVTIKVGDRIRWTNSSKVPHTVTADPSKANDESHVRLPEQAETFDSGFIQPGETYTRRFSVPGRYTYFCIPHEAAGMIGEIIVEE